MTKANKELVDEVIANAKANVLPYKFSKNAAAIDVYEYSEPDKAFAQINYGDHGLDVISIGINPKGTDSKAKKEIFAERHKMAADGPLYMHWVTNPKSGEKEYKKIVANGGVWQRAHTASTAVICKNKKAPLRSNVFLDLVPFPTEKAKDIISALKKDSFQSNILDENFDFIKNYLESTENTYQGEPSPIIIATGATKGLTVPAQKGDYFTPAYIRYKLFKIIIEPYYKTNRLWFLDFNNDKNAFQAFGKISGKKVKPLNMPDNIEYLNKNFIKPHNDLIHKGKLQACLKLELL